MTLFGSPRCTRRSEAAQFPRSLCPGAFGYCAGCPELPTIAHCRACYRPAVVQDIEHANRISGGFGCGVEGCPA